MKNLLIGGVLIAAVGFLIPSVEASSPPQAPDAGKESLAEGKQSSVRHGGPERLRIPSIDLDSPIVPVGENEKGEMDVPAGKSSNVGWYKKGTVPGEVGSAVIAAHVYAAFEDLHSLQAGDEIFLENGDGEPLRFVVEESKLTELSDVSPYFLFERNDEKRLNLITCAGFYMPLQETYSHRLIVYARLAE